MVLGTRTWDHSFRLYASKNLIPIIQGEQCGLTILPGSTKDFNYSFSLAKTERKGLSLMTQRLSRECALAGVCVGNAIIFNDRLLHGDIVKKLQTKVLNGHPV